MTVQGGYVAAWGIVIYGKAFAAHRGLIRGSKDGTRGRLVERSKEGSMVVVMVRSVGHVSLVVEVLGKLEKLLIDPGSGHCTVV